MEFGEPPPDVIARLYNEIKEKKILELDWKSPGRKKRPKESNNTGQKQGDKSLSPVKSDESTTSSKIEDPKFANEIDEFDNEDTPATNNISVTSFRSAVGKPKTAEKRRIDMNTVIANIERQQQEDERIRQGFDS